MARYTTLAQLRDAYATGRLTSPLMLDNDDTSVWADADDSQEPEFEMHPAQLLEDALALLGIPYAHV